MLLDTDRPIGASFMDNNEMKQGMIEIARHVQDRGQQQHWAEHLRLLTPQRRQSDCRPSQGDAETEDLEPEITGSENDLSQQENIQSDESDIVSTSAEDVVDEDAILGDPQHDLCSCSWQDSDRFRRKDRRVRLTSPDEVPGCIHYVAVSYCWSSSARAVYTGETFTISTPEGQEHVPACPSSLLDRVIQFAAWKQMEYVWIDQECIDQGDQVDQSVGIQAMDLVYQQAEYSLAVLEVCTTEQRHLDALEKLYENGRDLEDRTLIQAVVDAIQLIIADPWFERAWCLQESTSGNRQMTLLIRCDPDLEVPLYLASEVEECFELDLPWLHDMIASLATPLELQEDWPLLLQEEVQSVMDAWYENIPPDASTEYDIESRTVCNAAQALSIMERRQNSVVADRIAIMANLCGYDRRLDAITLNNLGFDFSICAFVLAVLNGDFSIQVGFEDYLRTRKSGRKVRLLHPVTRSSDPMHAFSWALPALAHLNRLSYFDHDALPLRAAVLLASLERGLEVEGCRYITDRAIDLKDLAESFLNDTYTRPPGVIDIELADPAVPTFRPRPRPDMRNVHFLIAILCAFSKRGLSGLVRLLWRQYRLRGTARQRKDNPSIVEYVDACFEEVIDVNTGDIKWPNPIPTQVLPPLQHLGIRTHPFFDLAGSASLNCIMETVVRTGRLLASRAVRSRAANSSYTALFEVTELDTQVFAPRMNSKLRTPYEYGWYPSNWVAEEIQSSNEPPEKTALRCNRSVCGLWEEDEEFAESVLLQ